MKKLFVILASFCFAIVMATSAQAVPYALDFDGDAGAGVYSPQETWGFLIAGEGFSTVHQQLGADGILGDGDRFYETWTVNVLNPLGPPGTYNPILGVYYPPNNIQVDIQIEGYINNYFNNGIAMDQSDAATTAAAAGNLLVIPDSFTTNYDGGTAVMYVDNNANDIFDGGDIQLADFVYNSSSSLELDQSVWGAGGSSSVTADYSVRYEFNSFDSTYFSTAAGMPDLQTLVDNGLLFAVNSGSIYLGGFAAPPVGIGVTAPAWVTNQNAEDEIILNFGDFGSKIQFDAVPEPASMLLLGTGLVGLAGASRRRKKGAKKA